MEPLTALGAVAAWTSGLRLMTIVVNSDLRHPALLHKAAITVDFASDGRLDLGLGAGWMAQEYAALGVPFDPAAERVARLAETVQVLKRLFAGERVVFHGRHHQIDGLEGLPLPVQRPHPPLLLGGGGRPIIELAGREADIVGIAPTFSHDRPTGKRLAALGAEGVDRKLGWLHEAAKQVGRPHESIELQLNPVVISIGSAQPTTEGWIRDLEATILADADLEANSPYVLAGSPERCAERLLEMRERWGFSYIRLPGDIDAAASLVHRLAGQ
jgi:probable F420-dependent oxidoreductase